MEESTELVWSGVVRFVKKDGKYAVEVHPKRTAALPYTTKRVENMLKEVVDKLNAGDDTSWMPPAK